MQENGQLKSSDESELGTRKRGSVNNTKVGTAACTAAESTAKRVPIAANSEWNQWYGTVKMDFGSKQPIRDGTLTKIRHADKRPTLREDHVENASLFLDPIHAPSAF